VVTPEQRRGYRAGWQRYREQRKRDLAKRYQQAMERARAAAEHLKEQYGCRVFLFGSMLRKDRFMKHSDIDIAVLGLDSLINFWKLYSEVMDILAPFDFDLIELEKVDHEMRESILKEGIEL